MSAGAESAVRPSRHRRQKDIVGKRGINGIMEVCARGNVGRSGIGGKAQSASKAEGHRGQEGHQRYYRGMCEG